jgi:hypothetical protein
MKKAPRKRSFLRWLLAHLLAPPPTIRKRRKRVRPANPPPDLQQIDRPIIPDEVPVQLSPDPPPLNFHAVQDDPDKSIPESSSQSPTSAASDLTAMAANDDAPGKKRVAIEPIKAEVRSAHWGYWSWPKS